MEGHISERKKHTTRGLAGVCGAPLQIVPVALFKNFVNNTNK